MGVSGHATIAAVTVALGQTAAQSGSLRVETITGIFGLTWMRRENQIVVTLDQNAPEFGAIIAPADVAPEHADLAPDLLGNLRRAAASHFREVLGTQKQGVNRRRGRRDADFLMDIQLKPPI